MCTPLYFAFSCNLLLVTIISYVYFKFVGKSISNLASTSPSNPSPVKLVPTVQKSYKMFFQNVALLLSKSNNIDQGNCLGIEL